MLNRALTLEKTAELQLLLWVRNKMIVRFEVFTTILLRIQVFCDVTLCGWENDSSILKECTACIWNCLTLEYSTMFIKNIVNHSTNNKSSINCPFIKPTYAYLNIRTNRVLLHVLVELCHLQGDYAPICKTD
jgi:hypothetical protein